MSAKQYVDLNGITVYDEEIKDYIGNQAVELTYQQYQNLPSSKLTDNVKYYINDVTVTSVDINDNTIALDKVWSSSKTNTAISAKMSDNPTFSEASTRANIASGESFSTILGKIMKWFTDFQSVVFSGSYNDLTNTPTLPSAVSDLTRGYVWTTGVQALTGATSCAITNDAISSTSIIEAFSENVSNTRLAPPDITISNHTATLYFDALDEDTTFYLRVTNL